MKKANNELLEVLVESMENGTLQEDLETFENDVNGILITASLIIGLTSLVIGLMIFA